MLFASLAISCTQEEKKSLQIDATLEGAEGKTIIVYLSDSAKFKAVDTLKFATNNIKWEHELTGQTVVRMMEPESRNGIDIFADNNKFTITGEYSKLRDMKIETLSPSYADYAKFEEVLAPINSKLTEEFKKYNEVSKTKDEEAIKASSEAYQAIREEIKTTKNNFIKENGDKTVAAFIAYREIGYATFEEVKAILNNLNAEKLKDDGFYQAIKAKYEKLESVSEGKEALDFTLNDPNGNSISLSSFRGKLLLLDFWASWCGPCRKENPHVVEIYEEFKDKGFDILGVSLDSNKDKWTKAIEDDGLVWNHVSDLKGWGSEVAALYSVKGIPHTILIDANGIIVAKNLRGEELKNKIAELLK